MSESEIETAPAGAAAEVFERQGLTENGTPRNDDEQAPWTD
jgi:hypothetical protein